ncbi:hypothetical protein NQ317_009579 [Molorchus minor]|uniref:Reverse transcriptase domain-containing protein n=1 Tax=Molorchus minor TaxID=1323400 RepID=A0ABQ9J0K2_9CUCU|nr:hypothetical protein NQ317_009579 [Molorchus minor]
MLHVCNRIKPKKDQASQKTTEDVKQKVNPVRLAVGIESVQNLRNGSIIISCNDKNSKEKIKNQVENELGEEYQVEEVKMKLPKFILINAEEEYMNKTDQDLIKDIADQNELSKEVANEILEHNGIQIICGDFNYDLSKYSYYGNKYIELIQRYGLQQIVTEYTRITERNISIEGKSNIHSYEKVKYRNYKNYDKGIFQEKLFDSHWDNNGDVNQISNNLINNITNIIDNMCPIEQKLIRTNNKDKKWVTGEVIEKMKIRDKKYKIAAITDNENDWREYRRTRNEVTTLVKLERERYFENVLDNNRNDPKKLWKNLKILLPNKNNDILPDKIKFGNYIACEDVEIAEKFNIQFIDSIKDIVNNINKYKNSETIIQEIKTHNSIDKFEEVTMQKLKHFLKTLKYSANLETGINTNILWDCCECVGNWILDVINESLSSGNFPEKWKASTIIPVPKVVNTYSCEEFRPINTVPPYEKLLELAVKDQVDKYCEDNSIIEPNQSGFRSKHSCEAVVISVCDDWLKSMDKGHITIAVNNIKYLGVYLDENLNFKKHVIYVMGKVSKKVGFLSRIAKPLSMHIKILLYNTIIAPHFEFCSVILFNINQNEMQTLQKIQNRAMRCILKCNRYTPIETMLQLLMRLRVDYILINGIWEIANALYVLQHFFQ